MRCNRIKQITTSNPNLLTRLSGKMWLTVCLLLAASLSLSLARPHLHPLSNEMVNHINKLNTTWKVSFFFSLSFLLWQISESKSV